MFIDKTFGPTTDEIAATINQYYKATDQRDITAEDIEHVKELIAHVGRLEFLILANDTDDAEGKEAAQQTLNRIGKEKLDELAKQGLPPPGPRTPDGKPQIFPIKTARGQTSNVTYSWVQLDLHRKSLGLSNKFEVQDGGNWKLAAAGPATRRCQIALIPDYKDKNELNGHLFLYSRNVLGPEPSRGAAARSVSTSTSS